MLHDFISLIYPRNCIACSNSLFKHEDQICNYCFTNLPKTNFHNQLNNPILNLFYGRVDLQLASSYYFFKKQGSVQKMLHAIKYKSNKEAAQLIGYWYGKELLENDIAKSITTIIPVPLHSKKLKQRGFNQSEEFARGIAKGLNIELNTTSLIRKDYTSTQTKKNKYERWENVENVFDVNHEIDLSNQHILIVDDVITTGATIEACCLPLKPIENVKLSVLGIAYASM